MTAAETKQAGAGAHTAGLHWTAEETHRGWGLRYSPHPGGKRNADGSTTYSLSFIALEVTDILDDAKGSARSIAVVLNSHAALLTALKEIVGRDDPDRPDAAMTGLRVSYGSLRAALAALTLAEPRSTTQGSGGET